MQQNQSTQQQARKNNARLYDPKLLLAAGINPVTGLPLRLAEKDLKLYQDMKILIRVADEQAAVNRYVWYNLPKGLTGHLIERILYYRAQGMMFYWPEAERFFFLPFALDGSIDVYGQFMGVTPVPFNGVASQEKDDKRKPWQLDKKQAWVPNLVRKPIYDVVSEPLSKEEKNNCCVLLGDYCKQISQTNIPRQILQDSLIDFEAKIPAYMNTALMSSTGVDGMRVSNEDQAGQVTAASEAIENAALSGKKWIPMTAAQEFQELTAHSTTKAEEFLLAMQSIDNLRLSFLGLDNGGLFQKKAHMLESENQMNSGKVELIYQDGLTLRQEFCDIVNSIWDLGIYVAPSDTVTDNDADFDGDNTDDFDQSGSMPGAQPDISADGTTGGEEDGA